MFEVKERDGLARLGVLETRHGRIETPALLPVVNPHEPTVAPSVLRTRFRAQALMTNAYILQRSARRGEFERHGVRAALGFDGPVVTDSGAFQSHVYGSVEVSNAEIIEFQKTIGSTVGTSLDLFSEPTDRETRAREDVAETLRRAGEAAAAKGDMLLMAAVQGGLFSAVRQEAAAGLSQVPIDVAAIGGVVPLLENYRFADLVDVIAASKQGLSPALPVHLFGAGHPLVFGLAALLGCDLFDSASYAKYAHDGRMMFPDGTRFLRDLNVLGCECPVCTAHTVADLQEEPTLIAEHNLWVSFAEVERVKRSIREGTLWEHVEVRCRSHPRLLSALRRLRKHVDWLERFEPVSRHGAFLFTGAESYHRPAAHRVRRRVFDRYRHPPTKGLVIFGEEDHPYGKSLRLATQAALAVADVAFVVKSSFGPVPLELDEIYPVSQSLAPEPWDAEIVDAVERETQRYARAAGHAFGGTWEGDSTLRMLAKHATGPGTFDLKVARLRATADYQFGVGAADALLAGKLTITSSRKTGKVRTVAADGEHVLSVRAHDGFFTLKAAGARRLHRAFSPPRLRVVVQTETAPFNRQGKNVMAKFVKACDDEVRPGDEVLVVDESDALLATGQAAMNREEMQAFRRGVAVHVREGLPV